MNRSYLVAVTVMGPNGCGFNSPVTFYESEEDAKAAGAERQKAIICLLEGSIIVPTPNGPKKAATVKELLGMLGVVDFNHAVVQGEVRGRIIAPPTKLILAGN